MGDAEVIPIGTRGRQGRGSGTKRPSSAARALAGQAHPAGSARRRTPIKRDTADDTQPTIAAVEDARDPVTTEERSPLGRISATDLWGALTSTAQDFFGDDWEPKLAALLASWRRRLSGDYTVDEFGFDAEFTRTFGLALLRPLAQRWFRIEVSGIDNLPETGGALVVSNHSGTVPVDGLMTMSVIYDQTGRHLRPLGADLVFRLPFVSSIARASGATLASNDDAERLLRGGELVGVWPEGFKGIGKPFSERYKLQRFGRGGFVSAAMRTGVPIVPLSVVGAEEIFPLIADFPALARLLGVPYVPITPTFPWLGPLGMVPLPSKWLMEFGEPVRTDEFEAGAEDDPMLVFNVTDQVRESIQQTLYSLLLKRGSVFG